MNEGFPGSTYTKSITFQLELGVEDTDEENAPFFDKVPAHIRWEITDIPEQTAVALYEHAIVDPAAATMLMVLAS